MRAIRIQGRGRFLIPALLLFVSQLWVSDANSQISQVAPAAPSSDSALLKSLRDMIDRGHPEQAIQQIAELQSAHHPPPGLNRLEGLAAYAEGDLNRAKAAFAKGLEEEPTDVESAQMLGLTLFRLGRPADAIPLLETPAKQGSLGKADPNYILALCYIDLRRYDDARHAFAAQFGFPGDSASAYLLASRMLFRREYLPVAQTYAEKALSLDATMPLAHELIGEILLASNRLDDAVSELEKEKSANPLEPSTYYRLGDAYDREAKYDDAQRNLQSAVLLEPNATGPYILLGKTMLKKGDAVAAVTYLEHANSLDPANFMTHSLLGQAYRAMGRREDATRETQTAEKIQAASEPKTPSAH